MSDAEQKERKNSNKQVNEALQMCICFPKIQTNNKKIKKKFSEVCYSQMCFGFLLHKQSCKWDLYKFVLISWPGAASRYLLHRRILIAASRVGRSLGSQCTEDEMQQAAVAWRGASSAEPPRSRRLHSDMAGSTLAPDLSVTFVLKITLLLSRRGVRDTRES